MGLSRINKNVLVLAKTKIKNATKNVPWVPLLTKVPGK